MCVRNVMLWGWWVDGIVGHREPASQPTKRETDRKETRKDDISVDVFVVIRPLFLALLK